MSVACLEGPTLTEFVKDAEAFDKCVDEQFDKLDTDDDGELSRSDLQTRHGRFSSVEFELQSKEEITSMYDTLFETFDADGNGKIDREEFRTLMREIVLAKARGIGLSPVLIILQGDSLLMRAVEHGLAKSN
ncbi:uncharacterized protein LOC131325262 [Rhododendron vialii]|uniref:uncharacterized protein LOC131325262 n=1 Tax=Rhododendron vialii TaxID=182163 RepID=UPI00265DBBAD|nr:uncharacterized protein LOC131325262 [Rhododendron vialii]